MKKTLPLIVVLMLLSGCATTSVTEAAGEKSNRAQPADRAVGSHLRRKPVQPVDKMDAEAFKRQSDLMRSDPTGEQITNGRN